MTWGELQWLRLSAKVQREIEAREARKVAMRAMNIPFSYQPTTNTETSNEHDRRPVDA